MDYLPLSVLSSVDVLCQMKEESIPHPCVANHCTGKEGDASEIYPVYWCTISSLTATAVCFPWISGCFFLQLHLSVRTRGCSAPLRVEIHSMILCLSSATTAQQHGRAHGVAIHGVKRSASIFLEGWNRSHLDILTAVPQETF